MRPTMFIFTDDIFFRNFRYLKEKYCLSRRALSKLLRISPVGIRMMENNEWGNLLELEKVTRISQIFGISGNDLISKDLSAQ